jgi:hypothetical protein
MALRVRDTYALPGSMICASRAAMMTPSPQALRPESITSLILMPNRNTMRWAAGMFALRATC